MKRSHCFLALVALAVETAPLASRQAAVPDAPELDAGFHLMYELKPEEARARFAAWQLSNPADPLGLAAEAASYLFEECYRQGILTSAFFLNDKLFLGKVPITPDAALRQAFFAADLQAQAVARRRLETFPEDANALFAMTLSVGMQADYASLIDKHQVESLSMVREANQFAQKLLAVDPDAADAYLTLGARTTSSAACRHSSESFFTSGESAAIGSSGSSSSRLPLRAADTYGPLRRLCWRWRHSARNSQHLPALNSWSWWRSFRRIRSLPKSSPHSMLRIDCRQSTAHGYSPVSACVRISQRPHTTAESPPRDVPAHLDPVARRGVASHLP